MLEKLIGAQIVSIDESTIEVKLDGKVHTLDIVSDNGDCCGYAYFTTNLLYSEGDLRNPIITNVEVERTSYDGDASIVTFYGEYKPLATIESEATSGSGWSYGAYVNIRCNTLDIDEDLASW